MRCDPPRQPSPRAARARRWLRDRSGATSIEYGLICALVFLSITASIGYFANRTDLMYNKITTNMR